MKAKEVQLRIIQNQIRCNQCGDEPYSAHRHDCKSCKCGAVAVDGGMEYLKRSCVEGATYTELSYSMTEEVIDEVKEAVRWGQETGRNEFGIALAVIRVLRKNDLLA
jgi:hypothetical protein